MLSLEDLDGYSKELGLDRQVQFCLDNHTHKAAVRRRMTRSATELGNQRRPPAFLIQRLLRERRAPFPKFKS